MCNEVEPSFSFRNVVADDEIMRQRVNHEQAEGTEKICVYVRKHCGEHYGMAIDAFQKESQKNIILL